MTRMLRIQHGDNGDRRDHRAGIHRCRESSLFLDSPFLLFPSCSLLPAPCSPPLAPCSLLLINVKMLQNSTPALRFAPALAPRPRRYRRVIPLLLSTAARQGRVNHPIAPQAPRMGVAPAQPYPAKITNLVASVLIFPEGGRQFPKRFRPIKVVAFLVNIDKIIFDFRLSPVDILAPLPQPLHFMRNV